MLFDEMEKEDLREYLDFLLWHYRVVDAFWYINIENSYDSETANHFNERVWERVAALAAKDILKRFNITEKGLEGFVKALEYFPWRILVGYEVDHKPNEVIITVAECPTQRSRINRELGEYACKEMHRREFTSFAKQVDASINVECDHAPPDPHPAERFCRWRFTI